MVLKINGIKLGGITPYGWNCPMLPYLCQGYFNLNGCREWEREKNGRGMGKEIGKKTLEE